MAAGGHPYEQHWSPYLAMSNNPVSFVDPDGGWDDWYDRGGVSFFVDGVQVESWEFNNFMNNPGHGDAISFSGMLYPNTSDLQIARLSSARLCTSHPEASGRCSVCVLRLASRTNDYATTFANHLYLGIKLKIL
jgi:hypothetical protein